MFSYVSRLHDLVPAWREAYQRSLPREGLWCRDDEVKNRNVFLICTNIMMAVYANLSGVHTSIIVVIKNWHVRSSDCDPN